MEPMAESVMLPIQENHPAIKVTMLSPYALLTKLIAPPAASGPMPRAQHRRGL